MTNLNHARASLHKAGVETSRLMSAKLRSEARASGWPNHIIRHLGVAHSDGAFTVHSHEDHRSAVMDLEYGTTTQRPTAAIRRFGNRQAEAERFLMSRTLHHMGGQL